MAVGDVVSEISNIAAGSYLTIQPSAGNEWVIHNIYHEYDIQLEYYDGADEIAFDTDTGAGVYAKFAFHVNNSHYLRIKNTHGSTTYSIGYDGIITKTT